MLNENNQPENIVRGHINIIILKALAEGDKYGYEIGKYIESKSEGGYTLKQPTLYSSLKRLENKNLIESYWGDEDITNGGRRKYFKLTEAGKNICSQNLNNWNKSKKMIDKLISDVSKSDSETIEKKSAISPVFYNNDKPERMVTDENVYLPKKTRSEQLFPVDDKKDIEYKKILSKLLSNVKKDNEKEKEEIEAITQPKQLNIDIPLSTDRPFNSLNIEQPQPVKENTYFEKEEHIHKGQTFDNKFDNKTDKFLNEKNYSLLPNSSEYSFDGFNKIQYDLVNQGFNINPYNDLKKHGNQYLLLNKINFIAALLLFFVACMQTAFIYMYYEPLIQIGFNYYINILSIFMVIPVIAGICYGIKPNRKTKKRFIIKNSIIFSLMLFIISVLGVSGLALLFNIDTTSHYEIVLKIIIPLIYASNFVFYSVIWGILYKTKKCLL